MTLHEQIRQIRNERDKFSKYIGVVSEEIRDGYGRVEATTSEHYANTCGTIHGGVLFSMADSASANAAFSDGTWKTTLNCSFEYLRAGKNPQKLIGEAQEVKKGKTISVYDATVKDEHGSLLARGSFTYFNMGKPIVSEEEIAEAVAAKSAGFVDGKSIVDEKDLNERSSEISVDSADLEIYFYRHGITPCNEEGIFAGVIDPELSEAGWKDLHRLKENYPFPQIDHIYVSPLIRTQQTASVLFPDVESSVIHGLHEYDFGDAEGKKTTEYFKDPEIYQGWVRQAEDFCFADGETVLEARLRIISAMTRIINEAKQKNYKRIGIVSHGMILGLLIGQCLITDQPREAFLLTPNGMGFATSVDYEQWFRKQKMLFMKFIPEGAERPSAKDSPYFKEQ